MYVNKLIFIVRLYILRVSDLTGLKPDKPCRVGDNRLDAGASGHALPRWSVGTRKT